MSQMTNEFIELYTVNAQGAYVFTNWVVVNPDRWTPIRTETTTHSQAQILTTTFNLASNHPAGMLIRDTTTDTSYRLTDAYTADSAASIDAITNKEEVSAGIAIIPDFNTAKAYEIGDVISAGGTVQFANQAVPAGNARNTDHWTAFESGIPLPDIRRYMTKDQFATFGSVTGVMLDGRIAPGTMPEFPAASLDGYPDLVKWYSMPAIESNATGRFTAINIGTTAAENEMVDVKLAIVRAAGGVVDEIEIDGISVPLLGTIMLTTSDMHGGVGILTAAGDHLFINVYKAGTETSVLRFVADSTTGIGLQTDDTETTGELGLFSFARQIT